jgi:hypothetical protein
VGKPGVKNSLGEVGVGGRIILKSILKKTVGGCGLDSSGSGYVQVAGCCDHSTKVLGSIKCGELLY